MADKVISLQQFSELKLNLKGEVVFTNGCFDILHVGHVEYLTEAKKMGHHLIVGLNSDASVRRLKGKHRPIKNQETRAKILAAFECVDYVILFEEDTPINLIKTIDPDILVKGGDYQVEKIVGYEYVIKNGGKVVTLPFKEGHSTTEIIHKIKRQ